jgi:hypothetical protein
MNYIFDIVSIFLIQIADLCKYLFGYQGILIIKAQLYLNSQSNG